MKTWVLLVSIYAIGVRHYSAWNGETELEQTKWYLVAAVFLAAYCVLAGIEKQGR